MEYTNSECGGASNVLRDAPWNEQIASVKVQVMYSVWVVLEVM